jgi:hypothetical protein
MVMGLPILYRSDVNRRAANSPYPVCELWILEMAARHRDDHLVGAEFDHLRFSIRVDISNQREIKGLIPTPVSNPIVSPED